MVLKGQIKGKKRDSRRAIPIDTDYKRLSDRAVVRMMHDDFGTRKQRLARDSEFFSSFYDGAISVDGVRTAKQGSTAVVGLFHHGNGSDENRKRSRSKKKKT
jgi:hypothetical protein